MNLSLKNINFPDEPCLSPNYPWELFIQNLDIQDDGEVSKVIKKQTNQKGFFDELMDTIKSFIKWFVILVIIGGIIAFFVLFNCYTRHINHSLGVFLNFYVVEPSIIIN